MVEFNKGTVEKVDEAETEAEALRLVKEYQMAFDGSFKRIWPQHSDLD